MDDQILQRVDIRAKILTPAVHELLEVGRFPAVVSLDHVVQFGHHLAHLRNVFRGHISQGLAHALKRLLQDLLLEHVKQVLEFLARGRTHEVVLLQRLDRPSRVSRQFLEFRALLCGNVPEGLGQRAFLLN